MIHVKKISIWKDTIKGKKYPRLVEDKDVDVLIIGGGITGISTLYYLKDSGLSVMLVEQNRLGYSVTGNSTGKLTFLQNDLIDKIRWNFNDDVACEYINSQIDAIKLVTDIIDKEKINSDLVQEDSYVYTNQDNEIEKLKDLEDFFRKQGIAIKNERSHFVQSKYMFGVGGTYLFHPIKFVYGVARSRNYDIYEDTSIQRIKKDDNGYQCYTDLCNIHCKWVIIATHYPYFMFPNFFPLRGSLEKSYLSASSSQSDELSLISYSNPFISIRSYKDYFIYLSNSHSINSNVDDKKNYQELIKKLNDLKLKPNYLWSNIDVMTNDGLPYIGEIQENMLMGTGYNTWGLLNGVMAGRILSDIIMKRKNKYLDLFSPKRINLSQVVGGITNSVKSIEGYIHGYFDRNKVIRYEKLNGKNVLIYQNDNFEHTVYRSCPHMGCSLLFNEVEKTWDCPCHGSRFDIDGKVISGPSNKHISVDKE